MSLDERHKIEMLVVDTQDCHRRAARLEQACSHAIASWQNRVSVLQRQIEVIRSRTQEQLLSKLVEKLLEDIGSRNAQIAELTKQKNQIQSNLGVPTDEEFIAKTQAALEKLIGEFEQVMNARVASIKTLISEMNKAYSQNVETAAVREDIQRVKIAIDLAKRDILQKQQVSQEIKLEVEEI